MALVLGGCTTYHAPALSVAEAAVASRTGDGVALRFVLNAENPNSEALPLKEVRYTVYVGGEQVFAGTRDAQATLRRLGTQQITLPAAVPASVPLPPQTAEYRLVGSLTYVTPGQLADVLVDAGLLRPRVSVTRTGTIDLAQTVAGK